MARGSVSVVVTTGSGSATSSVTLGQFGPSFSLLDSKHVAGIILRSDGSGAYGGGTYDIVGPTGTSLGYKTVAAKAGDVLELFGVGFGPTSPTVPAGQAYSGAAATTNPVGLSINNAAVTPTFAGITSAGLLSNQSEASGRPGYRRRASAGHGGRSANAVRRSSVRPIVRSSLDSTGVRTKWSRPLDMCPPDV